MLSCIVLYGYEMQAGGYTWSLRDNDTYDYDDLGTQLVSKPSVVCSCLVDKVYIPIIADVLRVSDVPTVRLPNGKDYKLPLQSYGGYEAPPLPVLFA